MFVASSSVKQSPASLLLFCTHSIYTSLLDSYMCHTGLLQITGANIKAQKERTNIVSYSLSDFP